MDIADWRRQIDELDQQLVSLINKRAECALEIGRLKRNSEMPVYEPDRERIIFGNIARNNTGPLSTIQMRQIFERLVDVMRQIQSDEMIAEDAKAPANDVTGSKPRD
jgi:chorismate mutase